MSVNGTWQGKLLDTSGSTSRVMMELSESGRKVAGEFSVYLEAGRDGCGFSGWSLAQVAPVAGNFASKGARLKLKYELKIGPKPIRVDFDARMVDADPHARNALVGTYTVRDDSRQIGFEGGGCVLWRYSK